MIPDLHPLAFIGPGGPEILVVMLALLLLFGAKDAPRIFRKLSDLMSQVRRTADSFRHEMMYGDIRADREADGEAGDYDDYGLGADEELEDGTEAGQEAEHDAPSGPDGPEDGNGKPV